MDLDYESCISDSELDFDDEDEADAIIQELMSAIEQISFKSFQEEDAVNELVLASVALSIANDAKM